MRYTIRGGGAILIVGGCYYLWHRDKVINAGIVEKLKGVVIVKKKKVPASSKAEEPIPQTHVDIPMVPAVPVVTMEPNFPQVPNDTTPQIKDRGIFEGSQLKRRIYPWN